MKTGLGILLVIAIIIIFLQNLCKPAVKDSVSKAEYTALQKAKNDTIAGLRQNRARDSAAINKAHQATADEIEKGKVYKQALVGQQETIDRLSAKIEAAKKEKPDNTFVKVSPNYVEGCDSLVDQNKVLKQANAKVQDQNAETVKLMMYEISVRDSALNHEKDFNSKFQSQLNNCLLQLKGKVDKKQPVQLYAGIGMLGNRINPIGGGQVNVSLRARNSMIYEVSGVMVGKEWYGGVGTKMLIRLRK